MTNKVAVTIRKVSDPCVRDVGGHLSAQWWYWTQEPLPDGRLDALAVFARTSGRRVFIPQARRGGFRVDPAALD